MAERKFTRALGRPGMAAQLREDVSQAVRATATHVKPRLADPIDFEEYVNKNKVVLNNDPHRELVIYPADDISHSVINRETRTLHLLAAVLLEGEVLNPLVKQCLTTYSQALTTISYKYFTYSGSYHHLPRLPRIDDLKEQVYEIDTDIEQRDLAILSNGENILKRGYLLKGPENGNEKIFGNFSAKTFKRKFACLRQEVDGTYILEIYKDERKPDSKGTLVMDSCTQINKNPRRGKCCFELSFSEGGKSVLLSAESEADLEDWIDKLTRVIHADKPQDEIRSERGLTPPANNYGTLRGLEHSLNPQLIKYAHETEFSIAQARKEDRHQPMTCYSSLPRSEVEMSRVELQDYSQIWPYEEKFGVRFRVTCENIKFKLLAPLDSGDGPMAQIEPYITTLALYDVSTGSKISENFHFDVNNTMARSLLSKSRRKEDGCRDSKELSYLADPLQLAGIPEEWLAYPKQAILSIQRPNNEIYLVLRIEKVLQGPVNQATEPYIKNSEFKAVQKLQKVIKTCWQRLGDCRMPFGWCARPMFKSNSDIDSEAEFSSIYKCEDRKISDSEIIKILADFRKPEKMSKLTIIPGSVSIKVACIQYTLPNSLTSSLEPVKPFPNPPTHEPTIETQEFLGPHIDFIQPHVSYSNLLYVYPKYLNYENQKSFSRARNLLCTIELRDSDLEGAQPLKIIYSRPGPGGVLTTHASTVVLHHNTFPEWYDEVKISLPHNLSSLHHLLFTFSHVSIEGAKAGKKEGPVETVGYAWLPLLSKGRITTDEQSLPVAAHLPAKYLSIEPLGLGKGFSGPEIRWVDNQKNTFKVQLRSISTVLTKDQHLHNFFSTSASLIPSDNISLSSTTSIPKISLPSDVEMVKNLKALLALEIQSIIAFLPTVLNQLFLVLLSGGHDVALNVTRVLVHITNEIYEAGREEILHSYVKYVQNISSHGKKTVHEELCRSLTKLLQTSTVDPLTSNHVLKHLQFFFAFVTRSMTIHLLTTARIKMVRNERFTEDYHLAIKLLIELLSSNIIQKYKENPIECRAANAALAHFLKRCLSMMDRGYVFGLIKLYLEHFNTGDALTLQSYKFTLLRIVCSHEHFIPLNLPIFNTPHLVDPKKAKLRHGIDEFHLTSDFSSHHFLVGALLSEVKAALGEVCEVQKIAISVLRDLLAKHSFDDRYLQAGQQGRIATLYFPFVSVLMENVSRLSWPLHSRGNSLGLSIKKGSDLRSSTRTKSSIRTVGSQDCSFPQTPLRSSLKSIDPMRYDASYLAIIAGPGCHMVPQLYSPSPLVHGRSSTSLESEDRERPPSVANSDIQEEDVDLDENSSVISKSHSRNLSVAFAGESGPIRYDKLGPSEVKDLLICFLYVLKHVPDAHLVAWWSTLPKEAFTNFFTLLTLCIHHFKYNGKRNIVREQGPKKASTLPINLRPQFNTSGSRTSTATDTYSVSSHEGEGWMRALQEANLATEVGLIILDVLCNFTTNLVDLVKADGSEDLLLQVFGLQMLFLQLGQSEGLMKHVFAALRAFINNYATALFQGDASMCGSLCFEMLKCCNSKLTNLRHEACAVLYLLMRSNYEFTRRTGINRVHLQVIISVSELLGEVIGLNNSRFQESMALINSYAASDKAMTGTGFVSEVRDLTKRIRTVLVATAQMREHERDPEMLSDLQHSLAASYAATPELRTTWLQAMSKHHMKNGDVSEAAFCQLHVGALMAEYLMHQGEYPDGCSVFNIVSSNIPRDESNLRLDAGLVDTVFTMDSLIRQLEVSANMLEKAERYELLGNLYRILIPIYESRRNLLALVTCYSHLFQAYSRAVEVNASQRRLLGRYYRVALYGNTYFEEEAGKEYVYKEPKVTSLAEISERLYHQYCDKFGKEAVKMIMDSNFVSPEELESRYAYIQVTHVMPHFSEEVRPSRQTEFEKNHNIDTFMFETPFTLEGKAHGKLEDQWKRRVLLTTAYCFPYVKKRIPIIKTEVNEMSPIEVAIDEMESRVKELKEILNKKPTDIKKLQLKLQGSISVQVNAGPLAYASTFLDETSTSCYPVNQVARLKEVYNEFMMTSKQALDLNGTLISSDQYEYQMALETNFSELLTSLSAILDEPLLMAQVQVDSLLKRSSHHYLNMISSPGGGSSAV